MRKTLLIMAILFITLSACGTQNVPVPEASTGDGIVIDLPRSNDLISSPLAVTGKARGVWFFEASLPLLLVDENGNRIAESYATAQGEWMTTEFVPLKGSISFVTDAQNGFLLVRKDNPSGLPEHDAELKIPVRFSE